MFKPKKKKTTSHAKPDLLARELNSAKGGVFEPNDEPLWGKYIGETEK